MNLSWLEDFSVLSASGNFSRAADERHMTQPAFSRRIRALEEWLGADLFDRSGQPARLTETGKWFVGVADEMLLRAARIPSEARAVSEATAMTLRIACTHALSLTFMPRWLRGMEEKLSIGPVSLVSDVLPRCEAMLVQGQVQFVLCHSHAKVPRTLAEQSYPFHVVGSDRLIPVSVPAKSGHAKHSLKALKGAASLLSYSPESGIGRMLKELKGTEIESLSLKSVVTAHTASVLRSMVLDGRGVAWLPYSLIADDLTRGDLVEAAPESWHLELDVSLFRDKSPIGKAGEDFWTSVLRSRKKKQATFTAT
ncbi:MAG TPA: LysR substrate-binding domain-containing protein [Burkholderiaceae bacterium]|nr:LysR substrate-binding domain-containing protein [Burkholderiaceae bacterium]